MNLHCNDSRVDMLPSLLFTLPIEIRLDIYELCIPCMWHRKRRVLLNYIVDSRWMAISPAIFCEAAPLVLRNPILFVHTSLCPQDNLITNFDNIMNLTFPNDVHWVLEMAKSMVERLAVTIRFPDFYYGSLKLAGRLANYLWNVDKFSNLKELYISLGPDYIPHSREYFDVRRELEDKAVGVSNSPMLSNFRHARNELRDLIPRSCRVIWRFDKAGMPSIPSYIVDRAEVVEHLTNVNNVMARLWI